MKPAPHRATSRTFIALFIFGQNDSRCVLFHRTTGAVTVCKLLRTHLQFDLPQEGMWDDDYRRVTNDVCDPPLKKSSVVPHPFHPCQQTNGNWTVYRQPCSNRLQNSTQCTIFRPKWTMTSTKSGTMLLQHSRAPFPFSARNQVKVAIHDTLCIVQRRLKNDHIEIHVFNLRSNHALCAYWHIQNQSASVYEIACFQRHKRCTEELELGSYRWDAMSSSELNEFAEKEFASIMSQTWLTSRDPLPPSSVHNLNSEQDGSDVTLDKIHSVAPRTKDLFGFVFRHYQTIAHSSEKQISLMCRFFWWKKQTHQFNRASRFMVFAGTMSHRPLTWFANTDSILNSRRIACMGQAEPTVPANRMRTWLHIENFTLQSTDICVCLYGGLG